MGETSKTKIVGLTPAAGKATRLAPMPFSKELYPIGIQNLAKNSGLRPKVVCHYLLEKMRFAGVKEVFIVLRKGKWDIPAYLGAGEMLDMHLAYLMMNSPFGVPFTLDQAYPFVRDSLVMFGFPDIVFQPDDAFKRLFRRQNDTNADLVLGLFPVDHPRKWDMVDVNDDGQILKIVPKPTKSVLRHTWIIAVWTPVFSDFMHEYLRTSLRTNRASEQKEILLSKVIQAAIDAGLKANGVLFQEYKCLDIGTPEDLSNAIGGEFCEFRN